MRPIASHAYTPFFSRAAAILIASLGLLALNMSAHAERPSAMKLFPEETLAFVRLANAHEFGERVQQTSVGRMLHDPQLKPFVEHLYGKAGDLYNQQVEGKLGITWDDLKKLPQGEVAFAVVARDHQTPALLLLVDQGDEASVADKLVDKLLDFADKKGGEFSKEKIGDIDLTVVRDQTNQNRMFGVFERDNTIVVGTDPNVLRNVLWHWDHPGADVSPEAQPSASVEPASKDKSAKESAAEFTPTRD